MATEQGRVARLAEATPGATGARSGEDEADVRGGDGGVVFTRRRDLTLRHDKKCTVRWRREWNLAPSQFAMYFAGRLAA